MNLRTRIYERVKERTIGNLQSVRQQLSSTTAGKKSRSNFVEEFFPSKSEYYEYSREFNEGPTSEIRDQALEEYERMTGKNDLSDVGLDIAQDYYAIVRELQPARIVETGVCNGLSSLAILLALQQNETGELYSIDYPYRSNKSLEEFRDETFENYGGAAIPSDKDPGWIIPDELRTNWELILGKSQRQLPQLVVDLESIDLFVHDSEHSHPCMMFEYELAYEWLGKEGVILSDDITWNDAFAVFLEVRDPIGGKLQDNVGYIRKRPEEP